MKQKHIDYLLDLLNSGRLNYFIPGPQRFRWLDTDRSLNIIDILVNLDSPIRLDIQTGEGYTPDPEIETFYIYAEQNIQEENRTGIERIGRDSLAAAEAEVAEIADRLSRERRRDFF